MLHWNFLLADKSSAISARVLARHVSAFQAAMNPLRSLMRSGFVNQ